MALLDEQNVDAVPGEHQGGHQARRVRLRRRAPACKVLTCQSTHLGARSSSPTLSHRPASGRLVRRPPGVDEGGRLGVGQPGLAGTMRVPGPLPRKGVARASGQADDSAGRAHVAAPPSRAPWPAYSARASQSGMGPGAHPRLDALAGQPRRRAAAAPGRCARRRRARAAGGPRTGLGRPPRRPPPRCGARSSRQATRPGPARRPAVGVCRAAGVRHHDRPVRRRGSRQNAWASSHFGRTSRLGPPISPARAMRHRPAPIACRTACSQATFAGPYSSGPAMASARSGGSSAAGLVVHRGLSRRRKRSLSRRRPGMPCGPPERSPRLGPGLAGERHPEPHPSWFAQQCDTHQGRCALPWRTGPRRERPRTHPWPGT